MASKYFFLLAITFTIAARTAFATDYIVGDSDGWTLGINYQAWAAGKSFKIGDKLIFKYPVGAHNVFKVNGTGFTECVKPPPSEALVSGNDVITLATPGTKWYICGVSQHCLYGQKLSITVGMPILPPFTFAPSPAPLRAQMIPPYMFNSPTPSPTEA